MSSKNLDEKLPNIKTLKKQLNNEDENVRFNAIQNLIKKLDEQDSKERINALETLSEGFNFKYPNVIKNSIDAVINSLDNKNEDVKKESVNILLKALENNKINKKNKNKINISLLIHNNINIDTKKNSIDSISNDLNKNKFDDLSENLFDKILLFLNNEKENEELKIKLIESFSNVLENEDTKIIEKFKEFLLFALNNKNINVRKQIIKFIYQFLYNNNINIKEQSINILYKALNNKNEDIKEFIEKKFESNKDIEIKKNFSEIYSKAIFNNDSNSQAYSINFLVEAILKAEIETKKIIYSSLKQILFNGNLKQRNDILLAMSKLLNIEDINIQNDIIDIFESIFKTDSKNAFSILKDKDVQENFKKLSENIKDIKKIIFLFKTMSFYSNKFFQNEKDEDSKTDILKLLNECLYTFENSIKNLNIELDENLKNNLNEIMNLTNYNNKFNH